MSKAQPVFHLHMSMHAYTAHRTCKCAILIFLEQVQNCREIENCLRAKESFPLTSYRDLVTTEIELLAKQVARRIYFFQNAQVDILLST